VYGWFERAEHGVYRLTELGEAALRRWPVMTTAALVEPSGRPAAAALAGLYV
jgi:hypothetical protein